MTCVYCEREECRNGLGCWFKANGGCNFCHCEDDGPMVPFEPVDEPPEYEDFPGETPEEREEAYDNEDWNARDG